VTSHSLGVLTEHDHFSVVLPEDSRIPQSATEHYTNGGPYTELDIMVFQGEHPAAFDNELVGSLPISFPEPRPRGYWDLAVTLGLTADGLLRADVTCVNNGDSWQVALHSGMRSDRSAVEESFARRGDDRPAHTTTAAAPAPTAAQGLSPLSRAEALLSFGSALAARAAGRAKALAISGGMSFAH
jgi:molecular chaperone DnaK (HSP70)